MKIETMLDNLAAEVSKWEFGREITLELATGRLAETNLLSIDEIVYIDPESGQEPEISHSLLPWNTTLGTQNYEPANFLDSYALRYALPPMEDVLGNHRYITVASYILDTMYCDACMIDLDADGSECDHSYGWGIAWAITI